MVYSELGTTTQVTLSPTVLWAAGVMIGMLVSFTDSGFEVLNFSVTGMGCLRLALN